MSDEPTVVFISYGHDSDEHREQVLSLSERLSRDGFKTRLDQYVNGTPKQGWPRWMMDGLDEAAFVLVVCTETYYRRFRGREEPGRGKGVDWEGALITLEMYHNHSSTDKFVPVLFDDADNKFISQPLRSHTYYVVGSQSGYNQLCDFLNDVAGVEPGPIVRPSRKPRRRATPMSFAEEPQSFETEREPNDVIGKVVGVPRRPPNFQARPEEINAAKSRLLADDKSSTGITALQGMGGIGKSVLAAELARDNDVLCRFPDGVFWVTVGQSPHRRVSLHDLQHDFITIRYQKKYGAPKALHIQLLDAYQKQCSGGWPRGPDPDDGYFFQHLAHHLRESGKTDELRTLLLDFDWLQSKLTHTDVVSLLSDFSHVNEDEDLRLLHDTIRLSAHVLASDSTLYMLSLHLADAD